MVQLKEKNCKIINMLGKMEKMDKMGKNMESFSIDLQYIKMDQVDIPEMQNIIPEIKNLLHEL